MHSAATFKLLKTLEWYLEPGNEKTPGIENTSWAKEDKFNNRVNTQLGYKWLRKVQGMCKW